MATATKRAMAMAVRAMAVGTKRANVARGMATKRSMGMAVRAMASATKRLLRV